MGKSSNNGIPAPSNKVPNKYHRFVLKKVSLLKNLEYTK
jgi:hypothetical protein